jgi:putative colanic acid biosynthesis UDP-glucose lipid carrier transferase
MDHQPARAAARTSASRSRKKPASGEGTLRIDRGRRAEGEPTDGVMDWKLRVLDVVVALAMLLVLGIPMLLMGALIKLTSPGPTLYLQERVGRHGRKFTLIKFRTMRTDAEAETGPVWAKLGDRRCTRVGAWLRRASLDELPQLFNVLRGDMSLVGPRPERPCFVRQFAQELPNYMDRHHVLPGITGWAQVNGWRGNTSIVKRLEHDLYYVQHRSLAMNLRILSMTPFRVLVERNAY